MNLTTSTWLLTVALIVGLLLFDLLTSTRKAHDVSFKEASFWSIFYIAVAIIFGAWVWSDFGAQFGKEYFAAYIVEKSLSVDNLFVFLIILTNFAVPSIYHQRVLMVGIVLALFMRAIFIALGAAALQAFSFTFVIFGGILLWTGIKLFQHWDEDPDPSENAIVRYVQKKFRFTNEYHGGKIFIKENGKRIATPLLLVMVAIGATDLLFALDSIRRCEPDVPWTVLLSKARKTPTMLRNPTIDRCIRRDTSVLAFLYFHPTTLLCNVKPTLVDNHDRYGPRSNQLALALLDARPLNH